MDIAFGSGACTVRFPSAQLRYATFYRMGPYNTSLRHVRVTMRAFLATRHTCMLSTATGPPPNHGRWVAALLYSVEESREQLVHGVWECKVCQWCMALQHAKVYLPQREKDQTAGLRAVQAPECRHNMRAGRPFSYKSAHINDHRSCKAKPHGAFRSTI